MYNSVNAKFMVTPSDDTTANKSCQTGVEHKINKDGRRVGGSDTINRLAAGRADLFVR